jgi:hypothetical protein
MIVASVLVSQDRLNIRVVATWLADRFDFYMALIPNAQNTTITPQKESSDEEQAERPAYVFSNLHIHNHIVFYRSSKPSIEH